MDIKIAFLLFCAVVTTECQFPFFGPVTYPGAFAHPQTASNPYSTVNNRNKNPPGKFHNHEASLNPSTNYNQNSQQPDYDQSKPDETSRLSHRVEQEYEKEQPFSPKNSQKLPATSSILTKPSKIKTESDPRQQSGNTGSNQEFSSGLKPNYNDQEYSPATRPNFNNQQNIPSSYGERDSTYLGSRPTFNSHDSSFPGNYQSGSPHISYQTNKFQPESYSPFQSGQQSYGPNSQNRQPAQKKPVVQRENEEKFEDYKPITEFSWNLFKRVSNPQQPNFVISPLSPQHLLSYLASGAVGETKDEIVRAIRYKTPNQLNSLVSTMLREPGNKELQLASALFVSNRIGINPEFQRNLAENTKIIPTDFSNAEKFNREYSNWVAEKTKGALKNVRVKPDPSTRMLMSSAVYFKGEWIFKLNSGGIEDFYVTESTPVKVPMMKLLKKLPYGKLKNGNLGEWISLPYNSNDSMVIILPREGYPLEELIQNLNVQDVFDSMNIDNYGNVTLTLPKFKVESKSSLVNPLQQMGIQQLFSTNAQLPNIFSSNEPLAVSSVLQQASLEVNEEGSIATSLTAVGVVALSFSPPTPDVVFNVNRPFVAMIIDRKNNFPYFIAKISNPAI